MKTVLALVCGMVIGTTTLGAEPAPGYTVKLSQAHSGFDGTTCWVHARAGAIPAPSAGTGRTEPLVVMTMQKLLLSGSDVFYSLNELQTADLSETWSSPVEQPGFGRVIYQPDAVPLAPGAAGFTELLKAGDETVPSDFTPGWHHKTQTLLGVGHSVWYRGNVVMSRRPKGIVYSTFDTSSGVWNDWKILDVEAFPELRFFGAGCVQRFDLENGEILLPVYGGPVGNPFKQVTILRCRFDGETLSCLEHGNFLTVPSKRGLAEPSLTRFQGKFLLTLRHDDRGYVSASEDGLHFSEPEPWTFDDDSDLGNYNTQQHWVTHSAGVFLVYTRRGANNDHVFRHRAPLFMAQVDPEKLHVIRSTEQALVPQRGARLGNFGVVEVSPRETWVTAAEWMQPKGAEKYGSDNTVHVVRLIWERPNLLMPVEQRSEADGKQN